MLCTEDINVARHRYLEEATKADLLLARAGTPPVTLTAQQVEALVGECYQQGLTE
jgi:hypothetical protein